MCDLALWVEWCFVGVVVVEVEASGWLAAMTGAATKAAAGRTNASAAIRRLYEVVTSGCSGVRMARRD